jgi:hypothetical protein
MPVEPLAEARGRDCEPHANRKPALSLCDDLTGLLGHPSASRDRRRRVNDGVRHQIKLTYGRRLLRLHQHPAFGGWAQEAGTILWVGC